MVVAFIDGKGMVQAVRIEQGIRKDLNEAVSQAVMQSRFKPAMLHKKLVKSRHTILLRFKLYYVCG